MSLQKQFEEMIDEKADKILKLKEKLEYLPEGLPDTCEAIITDGNHLRIGMPLDPPTNDKIVAIFAEAGYEVKKLEMSSYGFGTYRDVILHGDDDELLAIFDLAAFPHNEGSTCVIKDIGEVTETKKVFEVVCKEGAEEAIG